LKIYCFEKKDHEIVLTVNSSNRDSLTPETLHEVDAAIEFSNPASAIENIRICLEANVPMVIGTTGWYDQLDEVTRWCEEKTRLYCFMLPTSALA
jgi:4-hydroxy-tetrahydrodipicolinate reductase